MKYFLVIIGCYIISASAFSASQLVEAGNEASSIEALPDDLIVKIASFLDDKHVGYLLKTNKINLNILSKNNSEYGSSLRRQSKFGVTDKNGHVYFLDEFLAQIGRIEITNVNNINLIVKNNQKRFINLVFKSIPNIDDLRVTDFESFSKKTMRIGDLINDLPCYNNVHEKLAAFFIDLNIWSHVRSQAWTLISEHLKVTDQYQLKRQEVTDRIGSNIKNNINDQIKNHSIAHLGARVWGKMSNHIWGDTWDKTSAYFNNEIKDQVNKAIEVELHNLKFNKSQKDDKLKDKLNDIIDSIYLTYQLGIISTMHSNIYNNMITSSDGLATLFKNIISEMDAFDLMENINLPQVPSEKITINNQFDILKRHLN